MFTGFVITMLDVRFPLKLSVAVAPASVYVEPYSTVTGLPPFRVMTGGVESSVIARVVADEMFPDASRAVTERVFVASCVRFTDIKKLPPVAVPVAVVAPPVIVMVDSASAVPVIVIEGAFRVVGVVVMTGDAGPILSCVITTVAEVDCSLFAFMARTDNVFGWF